jgi:hypothetical protein
MTLLNPFQWIAVAAAIFLIFGIIAAWIDL